MTFTRLIARPMMASMFVVGGIDSLRNAKSKVDRVKPVTDKVVPMLQKASPQAAKIPTDEATLIRINGAVHVVGGLMLATGKLPRISALVLFASLLPTTLGGHRFWEETDPSAKAMQRTHFLKNVSMAGGLLVAAFDTEGKPGLAWRARRAAADARREARHAKRTAKQSARLAGKDLPFT